MPKTTLISNTQSNNNIKKFEKLNHKDCFTLPNGNIVYMKIKSYKTPDIVCSMQFNCICFNDGLLYYVGSDTYVHHIDVTIKAEAQQ